MLPLAEFLTVWALLAVNVMSPGPNVLNTITTAMGSGRAAGIASAMGVGLGIGIWCLGMTLGMAAVFRMMPAMRTLLTLVGIGLLLWFASRYFRNAWTGWRGAGQPLATHAGLSVGASFLRSLSVNASNPKALTTWVAVLTLFPAARAGWRDILLLWAGTATLGFTIHAAYALVFSTASAARFYLRASPVVNAAVGFFFIAFAVKLIDGLPR